MNTNAFFRDLFEDTLGLDSMGLEITYPELIKMIHEKTIKTFSANVSCYYHLDLDMANEQLIVAKRVIGARHEIDYTVSDPVFDLFNMPILGVIDVNINNTTIMMNEGYSSAGFFDILTGAESTYQASLMGSAFPYRKKFDLKNGNVLTLRNYPYDGIAGIIIRTQYPSLESIPEMFAEEFKTLCLYDIKVKLWNQLKYTEDIVTPNGNLNLKINDWDSAARERTEYLNELRIRAFPDLAGSYYFTTF